MSRLRPPSSAHLRNWWDEIVGALMVLTRLPVGGWIRRVAAPADCVWAYPLVGVIVGCTGGITFSVGDALALPPMVSAIWAVAAMVLATGGLHEDGLADTADGLGGGRSRTRKLEIMRDSRIGSFGALALILSVSLRVGAISALALPGAVVTALVVAAVAGRGAMILPLLMSRPARDDGLAAPLATMTKSRALVGLLLTAAVVALPGGVAALAAALVAGLAVTFVARRLVGGYTGDVLGAVEQLAECAALSACLSRFA